jgi:hypothetical protein
VCHSYDFLAVFKFLIPVKLFDKKNLISLLLNPFPFAYVTEHISYFNSFNTNNSLWYINDIFELRDAQTSKQLVICKEITSLIISCLLANYIIPPMFR